MLRSAAPSTLEELPAELLRRVFTNLDIHELCKCACVCSSWSAIALEPDFWRTISFVQVDTSMISRICARYPDVESLRLRHVSLDTVALFCILSKCRALRHLSISDIRPGGNLHLEDVFVKLTALHELDLSSLQISDSVLRRIEEHCKELRRLDISRCTLSASDPGSQSTTRVLTLNHPSLEELHMRGIRISSTDLRCPNLRVLDASGVKLTDIMLVPLINHSPLLRELSIAECRNVTDAAVRDVLQRCLELRRLDVSGCTGLTADILREATASTAPALQSLNMSRCPLLTDLQAEPVASNHLEALYLSACDGLKSLAVSSHSLRELQLSRCRGLTHLSAQCTRLDCLNLDRCEALSVLELRGSPRGLDFGDARGHLKVLRLSNDHLDVLDLQSFSTMELLCLECPALSELNLSRCASLGDESVAMLMRSCPQLAKLSLDDCEGISDLRIESPSLTSLDLSGCKAMEKADICCEGLHTLRLEGCCALERASLRCAVATLDLGTCRQLQSLQVASDKCWSLCVKGCLRMSDVTLACPDIRYLDLSFCNELTDAALAALASAAVEELNISRCVAISNALVGRLSELFPNLKAVNLSYLAIDDPTLTSLLSQPLALASLELAACKELRFDCLARRVAGATLGALRTLDVSYTNATADDVARWLALCPALEALKLNGCSAIDCPLPAGEHAAGWRGPEAPAAVDGAELHAWAASLDSARCLIAYPLACLSTHPTLSRVSLVGCHHLSWLWISSSCNLSELSVRSCAGLAALRVDGCPRLRNLSAVDCSELLSVHVQDCGALDGLDVRNCPLNVAVGIEKSPVVHLRR